MARPEWTAEEKLAVARCRRYAARSSIDSWVWLGPAVLVFVLGLYSDSTALLVAGFGLLAFMVVANLHAPKRLWKPLTSAIDKLEDACGEAEADRSAPR
jgi:hypothetical protein